MLGRVQWQRVLVVATCCYVTSLLYTPATRSAEQYRTYLNIPTISCGFQAFVQDVVEKVVPNQRHLHSIAQSSAKDNAFCIEEQNGATETVLTERP